MKATSILALLALKHKGKLQAEAKKEAPVSVPAEPAKEEINEIKEAQSETAGIAVLKEKANITVMQSNGTLKAYVRGSEYNLRVMKPSHGVGVSELKRSLERNREMVDQSLEKMIEVYRDYRLSEDPLRMASEDDYRTATKNALVARANIDVLIPLINMRGGDAEYVGVGEGMPIEEHIEDLRNIAEDIIDDEMFVPPPPEPDNSFDWGSFLIVGLIVVLVVLLLKVLL